jgi:hypothetical protein
MASPIVTNTSTELNGAALVYGFKTDLTNAQILALPTTKVQVIAATGANTRARVLGATLQIDSSAGAYTNVNTTYNLVILTPGASGDWLAMGPVNDATLATPLTQATQFFANAGRHFFDCVVPGVVALDGGASSGATAWTQGQTYALVDVVNTIVYLSMDNNGSGVLTGGNASNSGRVWVYYTVEATS